MRGYAIRFVEDEEMARDIICEQFSAFWEKRELPLAVSVTLFLLVMVQWMPELLGSIFPLSRKHQIEYLASALDGEERPSYYADFHARCRAINYYMTNRGTNHPCHRAAARSVRGNLLMSRFKGRIVKFADKLQISTTTAVEKHIAKALKSFSKHFKDKYPVTLFIL